MFQANRILDRLLTGLFRREVGAFVKVNEQGRETWREHEHEIRLSEVYLKITLRAPKFPWTNIVSIVSIDFGRAFDIALF